MNIDKRWILVVVAATATVIAALASSSRRRDNHSKERATDLNSWENEGGNLAAATAAGAQRESIRQSQNTQSFPNRP